MAATLTSITRIPYDAQHLPFQSGQVRQERHGVRVRRAGSGRREHPDDQAHGRSRPTQQGAAKGGGRATTRRWTTAIRSRGSAVRAAAAARRAGGGARTAQPDAALRVRHGDREGHAARGLQGRAERQPRWASLSPDGKTIIFARNHNLFMMDAANYEKARKNANDTTIVETQLTTDGEEYYSYARNGSGTVAAGRATAAGTTAAAAGRRTAAGAARGGGRQERARRRRSTSSGRAIRATFALVRRDVAQGQGPLGHQRAVDSASDARDLPLRDARRGEHAAVGDRGLRPRDEDTREDEGGSLQGSDGQHRDEAAAAGPRRRGAVAAAAIATRRADRCPQNGSATRTTSCTSPASAATCTARRLRSPTRRPAR